MKTATNSTFNHRTQKIADAIIGVIVDFDEYLPLTVRQVYYQLVAREFITNNLNSYQRVSRLLVKLRDNDLVPWSAIEDRSRRTTDKRGSSNVAVWLKEQIDCIDPQYYGRCLIQGQDNYVEVSTEKDAISSILEDELWIYCTRLNVIRGQGSRTIIEQMARRFDQAIMFGHKPILLHFGDLDPSGRAIPRAIKNTLHNVHHVDVDVRVVALNPQQVRENNLPNSIDAVKKSDPNYKAWLREYGPYQSAVELDALHPEILKDILKTSLADVYDIDEMIEQQAVEKDERLFIKRFKRDIEGLIAERYPELH